MICFRNLCYYLAIFCFLAVSGLQAQSNEFTYQGRLLDNTLPPTANYDFQFSLWDSLVSGTQQGTTQTVAGVTVTNGIFTVKLNFGSQFPGAARFLQIAVKPAGGGSYSVLAPRQAITSAPYSIQSASSASSDSLSAACNLCITDSQISGIAGSKVTGAVANATSAGNVSGIVAIANGGTGSSSKNFVDLTTNQTVGGIKTFANPIVGDGSQLTNINGANITNNTISSSALSAESFPLQRNLQLLGSLRWDLLGQQVTVGSNPKGIAFDGANVWVASTLSNNVTKLRVSDGVVQGTFALGGAARGAAFDGSNVWVTHGSGSVTKLRVSDGTNLGTFSVGLNPSGVAFDGVNIWVASATGLTKLRASDGVVQGTFAAGVGPNGVAFDGVNIWVVNGGSNNVMKIKVSDGTNLGTFAVGTNPQGIAFDGANIWVVNSNSDNLTKLKAKDGTLLGTFAVGDAPSSVVYDGTNIWVGNQNSSSVSKVRVIDGTIEETFNVNGIPSGICFDGANVWVANQGSNNVTRLPAFQ